MASAPAASAAEHVDAVVVGSGFGGSVAAYRLAQAGLAVVVLERGNAYPPDSFPRTPAQLSRAFWNPAAGLYGMFDVWRFSGCDSVVSSGLGGGSLIYANVLLRKDEHWFVRDDPLPHGGYESWPVTRADLDPHYDEVERMLGAAPFPLDAPGYADVPKAHAMRDAAAELGLSCQRPPLAISFAPKPGAAPGTGLPIVEPDYGNLHGRPRSTCRLCGECNIGCNIGAKNSLDYNYLSAAQHYGADLRTGHEVRAIRPLPAGGYEVDYIQHDQGQDGLPAAALPLRSMTCDRLVLAAGTLGTTYLLLRNRPSFRGLSAALGTRFSSNGDVLSFLINAKNHNRARPLEASRGPVITSAIRLGDEHDGAGDTGRGAYIEDGGYPAFVDWLVEAAHVPGDTRRLARFALERLHSIVARSHETDISGEISELIGSDTLATSSLPLLGMGRDTPDGLLWLHGSRLDLAWTTATSEPYFERVLATMRRIAAVLGARYVDNPMWRRKRIITVHPVGGAPMGRDRGFGVCDSYGEVFGYPGLYIADGAVMPGPVGPNPSLTIAALADRMCTRLLEQPAAVTASGADLGGTGPASKQEHCPPAHRPDRTSLSFTEEMNGMCTPAALPGALDAAGQGQPAPAAFRLTITTDDVTRFLEDPEHLARADGWIDAAGFGGRRHVQRGWFNLFAPDGAPDLRLMRYRLQFSDASGQPRTFIGRKDIWHGPPSHIWPDTSTLHFRVVEGHVDENEDDEALVLAAGTLHLRLTSFARQLTTIRTEGPDRAVALERFGRFFAGQLWDVYGPSPGTDIR